jgi:hypothetical protein
MTEEPGIYDVGDSQPNEPPRFEEHLVHTSASIRITGHKQEIDLVLNALARAGFFTKPTRPSTPAGITQGVPISTSISSSALYCWKPDGVRIFLKINDCDC